jgi:hypothetical protein
MCDIFHRIAKISETELISSQSKNIKTSTLWETDEYALRFLIEEGKLNICFQSMIEYKSYQLEQINALDFNWVCTQT